MEKIVGITEISDFHIPPRDIWPRYDGYKIHTDAQTIVLGISNSQCCCENWGYFMTNDDLDSFLGTELLSVDIVDTCLNKEKAPEMYEGDAMFVNFETSAGTLQFVAYNEHNGYYGHDVVVVSRQLKHSDVL